MKQKTGRKLLSFLLALAMLVGLMPGMSLTAYAAPTEKLLTTITATGKEQASYSTDGVATVSFSYTAYGSSAYLANWGWWGYGWTATVTPANGYTITKCVFYDDQNRTATDIEKPFVVETTEEDKTPKVNGTPIVAYTSKGIKKIEVYGYATSTATHSVTITAGDHMTKTTGSGAASQTDLSGAMTAVVYTADDGYYFPDDYSVAAVNGITVTRNDYTQITVSGTPTVDAEITLTAPTAKTTPDAPTTAAAVNCTTASNNDGKLTGVTTAMEYKKSDAENWTAGTGSDITDLVPGTYYVRYKATDTTNASGNQELSIAGYTAPTYEVTYKVANGTWSDDSMTDKKETVQSGSKPASVPTGMKAASGYTGGSWDNDPTDATITGATTFTYTFTAIPTYEVTYKVVNGTWSDDSTTDKTETVQSGSKPASVPTGMKAASGYTGGSWDNDPTDATITGATTFTYTFTAIPTYEVTYKVVNGTWSDDSMTDKKETVQSGSKPASVPTGMKAASGYTGGSWDNDPTDATITGATTFTYTFTAIPTYEVTYKVVNGTWSDDSMTDKKETVQSGSKPASVPTGMKAASGYTGGSWDNDPTDATITGATTFTYTFTAKQAATVTKVPTAKTLTYTGSAQELVEAGEANGGTMQYALGTATEATQPYTTSIPTATNAGTYYVWYKVIGDANHNDTAPDKVAVTISKATVTAPTIESKAYTGKAQTATIPESTLYTVTANNGGTEVGNYEVVLTLSDTANYKWTDSEEATKTLTFTITQADAPEVTAPTLTAVTYDPAKTLADIDLPQGWEWVTDTIVPAVVNNGYEAMCLVDDGSYDYTGVTGYDAQLHVVIRTVPLTVNKADPLSEAVPAELVLCSSDLIYVHGTAGQEYIIVLKGTNVTPESWENKTVPDSGNDYLVAFEDLSAATEYDVYTRISETANYKAGDAVNTPVHTTIDYTELDYDSDLVGATLTVRPYPENNDYTYKWYRDDRTYYNDDSYQSNLTEIAGVQGNTYTFTADDCGKYIAVKIFVADSEVGDTDFGPIGYGKVLFDSKGGSEVSPVTGLSYGSNVTKPADPEKEGYSFAGWYEDEEYDEEYLWNFDTDTVMWQETTLYAKWVASEKELPYKDVKEIIAKNNGRKPYYYKHLQFLYDHNIMTGLKPDLFGVGAYLTREQAATLLYRYAGSPAVNSDGNPFPDVKKPSHWAYNAIVWAKANGVITGYTAGPDKGMFGPEDDITREQFMVILWRWAKTSGYDITPDSDATYKAVADSNKLSTWAVEAVNWGYEKGIIGNKSLFKPQDNLTREDAATMLHRYIEVVSNLSKT